MKNLSHIDTDRLESLPRRTSIHGHRGLKSLGRCNCSACIDRRGNDYFPYDRIHRWLRANVGKPWDKTIAAYTKADWVPGQHRTYSKLAEFVEVNTFVEKGKTMFFASHFYGNAKQSLDDTLGEIFYVCPETKTLKYKPKVFTRSYRRTQIEERTTWLMVLKPYDQLIKLDGIWYHVWANPTDPKLFNGYGAGDKPLLYDTLRKRKEFIGPLDPQWETYILMRPKIYKVQLGHGSLKHYGLTNDRVITIPKRCKVCGGEHCAIHAFN